MSTKGSRFSRDCRHDPFDSSCSLITGGGEGNGSVPYDNGIFALTQRANIYSVYFLSLTITEGMKNNVFNRKPQSEIKKKHLYFIMLASLTALNNDRI